ncbi:hypothetical protein, partial [Acidaminococcus timonensis]|uniref:hypothetical protein n=1 Tax=Acidaminococcus timonensis TaxID=1871002 RepID=UPI002941F2E6
MAHFFEIIFLHHYMDITKIYLFLSEYFKQKFHNFIQFAFKSSLGIARELFSESYYTLPQFVQSVHQCSCLSACPLG